MLSVRGLSVVYASSGTRVRAVSQVSFDIGNGRATGLLGESGSGKSTTARALVGLLPQNAAVDGDASIDGAPLLNVSQRDLEKVRGTKLVLISQDPAQSLNPVMTIGTQVSEPLRAHESVPNSNRKQRVLEALHDAGFADPASVYSAYPHQISGGERQRAAIAQAIVCRPALLVADEPTTKLDPRLKWDVMELFAALRRRYDMALLLISHDPAMIARYTDHLAVMYAGEIVEAGETAEVVRQPMHPYTHALLQLSQGRARIRERRPNRLPVIEGEAVWTEGAECRFQPRCDKRLDRCVAAHPAITSQASREIRCFQYSEQDA